MHIVGLTHGQNFRIVSWLSYVYVEGKPSQTSGSHDMGTFLFPHTFQLEEEEQLVSLSLLPSRVAVTHIVAAVMSVLMALQTHHICPIDLISACEPMVKRRADNIAPYTFPFA